MTAEVLDAVRDVDVIVVDAASRCGSVVRDVLQVKTRVDFLPVTMMDPFFLPRLGGANPIHAVPQMGSRMQPPQNIGERVHNSIVYAVDKLVEYLVTDPISNNLRQKHNLSGTHAGAMADTGMMIVQTSWAVEFPRAVPPSVKLVGPILPQPPKALPAELESFVSDSKSAGKLGTVLVSFGSQARVTQDVVDKLATGLGALNANILWKLSGIKPSKSTSKNIKIVKWFPQNDLLGHENVIAFLSHGGLNGVSEAAYHGVPVVGFPLFGDQWDNIARLQYHGMAEVVDSESFTSQSLTDIISKVILEPSYAAAANKVKKIVRDTPKPPVELAADWIEYAIRHDGALFLKVPGIDAPWGVNNGLDVLLLILIVPAAFLHCACRRICGRKEKLE